MEEKNYTITFFGDFWDYYDFGGKKYYLLILENDKDMTKVARYIQANNNRDLTLIKDLIRNDRMLLIKYLLNCKSKQVDELVPTMKRLINKFYDEFLKECE